MRAANDYRDEARRRGLKWAAVVEAYRELKTIEWEKRQRPNEIRAVAWMMHTASTPGSWPFWRHGFASRFRTRLARGADHTIVPGYDEIAQQIATEFPEYAGDDGTGRLWDFLFSQYDKMPSRYELLELALDLAEQFTERIEPEDWEF